MRGYVWEILVGLDRLGNAVLGGSSRDTISHRSAVAAADGNRLGIWVCRRLDWFDPGHCARALND